MDRMRALCQRWLRLLRREGTLREISEELEFHLEQRAAQEQAAGESAATARRRAEAGMGDVEEWRERGLAARRFSGLDGLAQDFRMALRGLRRGPGVALTVIACLALGLGASAAVASWIEGVLLRPFPQVAHQERMLAFSGTERGSAGVAGDATDISWPDFQDYRSQARLFDWFVVDHITSTTLAIGQRAERAIGSVVSANYFDALGVRLHLGRSFSADADEGRNAHAEVVISDAMWRERFGADPRIIGRAQVMNGVVHTIVGVAPAGFNGTFVGRKMQFWVPVSMQEVFVRAAGGYVLPDRGGDWIEGYARLKPGVSLAQAQAEVSAIAGRLARQYPASDRGRGLRLFPLSQAPFTQAGVMLPTLTAAAVVAGLLLLIVCANVGNLLLLRALGRRREMTLRLALGARRGRLLRPLLLEGAMLGGLAWVAGLGVAYAGRNLLAWAMPGSNGLSLFLPATLDGRVLGWSAALCLGAVLLFALLPALAASRMEPAAVLRAEAGSLTGSRTRLRAGLVIAQLALSLALMAATGLLLRSLWNARVADPGFATQGVMVSSLDLTGAGYSPQRMRDFEDRLLPRLRSLPGVRGVAFMGAIPFSYRGYSSAAIQVDGYQPLADERPVASYNEVDPGYLSVAGISLLAGRGFSDADTESAAPVVIVNQAMAGRYWHGANPVGLRLVVGGTARRVVGLAQTTRINRLGESPQPFFYLPARQSVTGQALTLRSELAPAALTAAVRAQVAALDPNLTLGEFLTMRQQMEQTNGAARTAALMLAAFAVVALALAAIGLYGLMAGAVAERRRELGLRLALGATPARLVNGVVSEALRLVALGAVIGLGLALAGTRLLGYLLYRVSPHDPAVLASVTVLLALLAAVAALLPARRAAATDPVTALRQE